MYNYYSYEELLEKECKRQHRYSTKRPITANEWRFQDSGAKEPVRASWNNIMAAYNDARTTDSYVYGY